MDTQSNRVMTASPGAEAMRLRTEVEDARDGLGYYVSEVNRRRLNALKRQLRDHRALAIGVGVVTVAAAAGAVALAVRSRRSATNPLPWSPWRVAPSVEQKSRRVAGFLLGTAVPFVLKAARGVVERRGADRPRLACLQDRQVGERPKS